MSLDTLVTIGITAYNSADTIGRAIRSAIQQDFASIEIVVVDDCSRDGTWDALLSIQAQHPDKIRIYQNDSNMGVACARNRIIKEARGEFLVFFDDDDESLPGRVTAQVSTILMYEKKHANGAPVVCHSARIQVFPDGRTFIANTAGCVSQAEFAPHGYMVVAAILYNERLPGGNGAMATCSQAARTCVYRQLGGFDPFMRRSEDTDFCIRLARSGGHFIGLSTPLVRQHMTLAQDKKISDERKYVLYFYSKHSDVLKQLGRGRFDMDWINIKYDYLEGNRISFFFGVLKLLVRYPSLTLSKIVRALPNRKMNRLLSKFYQAESRS